jgi:uncharacterized phage-associated protein
MAKPYTPLAFANEFILKSAPAGVEHMKLQKLVYIAYGWWLSVYDEPVLNEAPEVWKHGPVFQSLYHMLKEHGRTPICHPQSSSFNRSPDRVDDNDDEVLSLIDWVWSKYRHLSSFALSDLTHEKGSPWQKTVEQFGYRVPFNTEISLELIKEHYRKLARELTGEAVGSAD